MIALFDRSCDLVGWMDVKSHDIFDPGMRWVGFWNHDGAFRSNDLVWIGPLKDGALYDQNGKMPRLVMRSDRREPRLDPPLHPNPPARARTPHPPARPGQAVPAAHAHRRLVAVRIWRFFSWARPHSFESGREPVAPRRRRRYGTKSTVTGAVHTKRNLRLLIIS